jgi:hypothetical protein
MIWQGIGIIATVIAFIKIAPPFNSDKSNAIKETKFSNAIKFLVVYWICAEGILGFVRDPIADTYTGNVYLVTNKDGHTYNTPLKAKLKLDVVDNGYVFDRRPGVTGDGIRMEFTGDDLEVLKRYGIPAEMINGDGRDMAFAESFCQISKVGVEKYGNYFGGSLGDYTLSRASYAAAFHLGFGKPQPGVINCGKAHLGVLDFNKLQFAMDDLNPDGYIFADLRRDSHISFVQRMVMSARFDSRTIITDFGHQDYRVTLNVIAAESANPGF